MKKVFIYTNEKEESLKIKSILVKRLSAFHIESVDILSNEVDLIFSIGGDGTLLGLMQKHEFPTIPICGINAGHLGFFQELVPSTIDVFLDDFLSNKIKTQPYNIVKASIQTKNRLIEHRALNEFAIKGTTPHAVHYDISINSSFIEKFSGDGILVCSPAGSTGYNYSLGGSIVDPRLNILQVTPISPMNNVAYRSLTSSILLPSTDELEIYPSDDYSKSLLISYDGECMVVNDVESIKLSLSKRKINLVRFNDSRFWEIVKGKFL